VPCAVLAGEDPLDDHHDRLMHLRQFRSSGSFIVFVVATSVSRSRASASLMALGSVKARRRESQMPRAAMPAAPSKCA
jgi:hypothetical protein